MNDRDRIIKRKLLQGFPNESRKWLENFTDNNIPLSRFVEHVKGEKTILLKSRVEVDSTSKSLSQPQNEGESSVRGAGAKSLESSLSELTEKVDKLQKVVRRTPDPKVNGGGEWACQYCRSNDHLLRECWRKPPWGHCFNCRRFGCMRGRLSCLGRVVGARAPTPTPTLPPKG